jgi:hypothetical protein
VPHSPIYNECCDVSRLDRRPDSIGIPVDLKFLSLSEIQCAKTSSSASARRTDRLNGENNWELGERGEAQNARFKQQVE